MQILSSEQHPPWSAEVVCRQSRVMSLAATLVYIGLFAGLPATFWFAGEVPDWLAAGIGLFAAIVLPFCLRNFIATLRASNWTLAMNPDSVWLNLRSYSNHRFEPGQTVVLLSYRDLASVHKHVIQRTTPTGDGVASWTERSLELRLRQSDSGLLKRAIDVERKRQTSKSWFGGLVTVRGRSNHVPIALVDNDVIRVRWRSRHDFLRPGLDHVLDRFSIYVNVADDNREREADESLISDEQMDTRVLQLVEAGDKLDAIKLLTLHRGFTTTEAKRFIEELDADPVPAE